MESVGNSSKNTLLVLCLASGLWAFSFGVEAPVVSLWLHEAGYSATLIGLNTGAYYFGIMAAAAFVPWLMRRCGMLMRSRAKWPCGRKSSQQRLAPSLYGDFTSRDHPPRWRRRPNHIHGRL